MLRRLAARLRASRRIRSAKPRAVSGEPGLRTPSGVDEKIVHLRLIHHFGPTTIAWYLGRYRVNDLDVKARASR